MKNMQTLHLNGTPWGNTHPLGIIAGPCVLEGHHHAIEIAHALVELCKRLEMPFVFKASFDKANRTSAQGSRGLGWEQAAETFQEIRQRFGCCVLTDVHESYQCREVAKVVDILQIPALLCRQTDLIEAAAKTNKPLHIKKGQFLSPQEMVQVILKAKHFGNHQIMVCERGTSFGYNLLVNDMRALPQLAMTQCPVIFDATHSVQRPGGLGHKSGGDRCFVEALSRAAVSVGVAGLFLETHPDPDQALSDGPNMIPLAHMEGFLHTMKNLDALAKTLPYQAFSMSALQKAHQEKK